MSEYRSPLRAARERIEQLEAQLPRTPPPPSVVSARRLLALLAAVLPITAVLAAASAALAAQWPQGSEVVVLRPPVPPPIPPVPAPAGLEWLAQTWFSPTLAGPEVTDRDASGVRLIIGLAWDRAREEDGLVVVAHDSATLAQRWTAGPYPSARVRDGVQHHYLARIDERVLVTDLRGVVHVLDAQTGLERASKQLPSAPSGACVVGAGKAARLILPLDSGARARGPHDPNIASLFPWELNRATVALDPLTARTAAAPPFTVCEADHYCRPGQADGCRSLEHVDEQPIPHRSELDETWKNDRVRVGVGAGSYVVTPLHVGARISRSGDRGISAVGWTVPSYEPGTVWTAALVDPLHEQAPRTVTWGALFHDHVLLPLQHRRRPGPARRARRHHGRAPLRHRATRHRARHAPPRSEREGRRRVRLPRRRAPRGRRHDRPRAGSPREHAMTELQEAHRRIAEIEAILAGRAPRTRVSGRRIARLVALVLAVVLVAGAAPFLALPRPDVLVVATEAPPRSLVPEGALVLRTGPAFHDRGPALVDSDGDGAKDVLVLAWRHGQDDLPLHAVLFDRKTYAVRWRAGPYPARWRSDTARLDVDGRRVFVDDGVGTRHELDLTTGRELGSVTSQPEPQPDDDGCGGYGTGVCVTPTAPETQQQLKPFFGAFTYSHDITAGADRFTQVSVPGPQGTTIERAMVWEPNAKRPSWNVPLVPPPQRVKRSGTTPNAWTALAHGRVLHLYQESGGGYRIAGRDVNSGALAFDSAVPGLGDGALIGAFTAEGEDAFVVANESLFVLDGRTGQIVKRLSRF